MTNEQQDLLRLLALRIFRSEVALGRGGAGNFSFEYDHPLRHAGLSIDEAEDWAVTELCARSLVEARAWYERMAVDYTLRAKEDEVTA